MDKRILMVCLGNICRSPVADGILKQKAKTAGITLEIDSCGTAAYHVGESPDKRAQANALQNGLDISMLRARQLKDEDLSYYDRIYCMDKSNLKNTLALAVSEEEKRKVKLILDHTQAAGNSNVPDPYYGDGDGFQKVYDLLNTAPYT
jgi:protein-tyrosine phosphatase